MYMCTEAMLLHSGYHSMPRRRRIWELKPDCHKALIADNIRRREVDAVLSCLHFWDNSKLDNDGYFKVQLLSLLYFSPNPPGRCA